MGAGSQFGQPALVQVQVLAGPEPDRRARAGQAADGVEEGAGPFGGSLGGQAERLGQLRADRPVRARREEGQQGQTPTAVRTVDVRPSSSPAQRAVSELTARVVVSAVSNARPQVATGRYPIGSIS